MNEKRHKEAQLGRKFSRPHSSSVARHYGILNRGGGLPKVCKLTGLPTKRIILPKRRCMLLNTMDNTKAIKRSHSMHKTKRVQKLNLHTRRLYWEEEDIYVKLRISMRAYRTIRKLGLQKAAEKYGLNLRSKKLFAGTSLYSRRGRKKPASEGTEKVSFDVLRQRILKHIQLTEPKE